MKFQSLDQFRKHEYGASLGRFMHVAVAVLGGAATIGLVFALVHLSV